MVPGCAGQGLDTPPFATALVLHCPEEGQILVWAHPPQPPHVWDGVLEQKFLGNGHSGTSYC